MFQQFYKIVLTSFVMLWATFAMAQPENPDHQTPPVVKQPVSNTVNQVTPMEEEAFGSMTNALMPLSVGQIHKLRALYNEIQKAAADSAGPPPKASLVARRINLSPHATPPIVRLGAGFISSIVFLDSTGAPWPIKAYDIGDPNAFNIQWDKKSNTLLIQAITAYKRTNLAVILKGLNTPVMITLLPGQRAVDYRVDLQVPRIGPNAVPLITALPMGADDRLLDVLNGISPPASRVLRVTGGEARAWWAKGTLFLRTPLTIVSPGWISKVSSSDGVMHAYSLGKTPVVLALQHGHLIKLVLKGF